MTASGPSFLLRDNSYTYQSYNQNYREQKIPDKEDRSMKKELILMLTAAALGTVFFSNITADKASAKTSGDYKYVITGKKKKTCAIRKYLGKDKDVVIPEKIDGYTVTRIGNRAFKNNDNIKSIKLSKHITIIGESSFYGCDELKDITFPKKFHTIKTKAFEYCYNLKNITLPSKLKTIGKEAFCYCPITEINIPQYVKSIGYHAFLSHRDIGHPKTIKVDKNNKYFDSRDNCNALIKTSTNTLIKGTDATVIPDGISTISDYAFSDCVKLKKISIPSSVKTIGEYAFSGCDNLEQVNLTDGLITIENDAFYKCDKLKEIILPDSLETIGNYALCTVEKINIPKNLKKTDFSEVFGSLTNISVAEGNQFYDSRDNCNAVIESSSNTLVLGSSNTVIPDGISTISDHAFSDCVKLKKISIPSSVKTIGEYAFSGCDNLEQVNLTDGLITIENDAFYKCDKLKEIILPDSLETIGNYALCTVEKINIPKNLKKTEFSEVFGSLTNISVADGNQFYDSRDNCNAVIESSSNTLVLGTSNTVIPDSVTAIGDCAFRYCDGLKKITIPSSVITIGERAFLYCENLNEITIPDSVTAIDKYAFCNCIKLKAINIPSSVKTIGEDAFSCCESLEQVNLTDGLISIEADAFEGCSSLKEIDLPDSLETIGRSAFYCRNLEKINIPKNLKKTEIELEEMFAGYSLKNISVAEGNQFYDSRNNCNAVIETSSNKLVLGSSNTVIPDSVTAIDKYAFGDCIKLEEITIPSSVKTIGIGAFEDCDALKRINLDVGLISIERWAFGACDKLKTINYRGSKAQWKKIKIVKEDYDEDWLSGIKINYNYKG